MVFTDKYTTSALVTKEAAVLLPMQPSEISILGTRLSQQGNTFEKDKTVLSNDFYAIGQLLETLINTRRN